MQRRLRALILLLAIAWQSVGMLSPWLMERQAADWEHASVHAQEASHHHHDDESLHIDGGADDRMHVHAESALQPPGVMPQSGLGLLSVQPAAPTNQAVSASPAPDLEGLYRPPKSLA